MGRRGIGWALGIVAPWCLGFGLVVSFTADAGQDMSIGATLAPLTAAAVPMPLDLVPSVQASRQGHFRLAGFTRDAVGRSASLFVGEPEAFREKPDEIEPRIQLKKAVKAFPTPDRSRKGDPVVGLRPTFDAKLRQKGSLAAYRAGELLLSAEDYLAFDGFAPPARASGGSTGEDAFEPWPETESSTSQTTSSGASPGDVGSSLTLRSGGPRHRSLDGSTPAAPRAVALGSTTPAPADRTPIVVALTPAPASGPVGKQAPNSSSVPRSERPNYASLIDQDQAAREVRCLAEAIYFEARSEPEEGQAAVAQVVLNRVSSGLYPTTVCAVVYQNKHRHNACQFSFACEGKALRVTEPEPWRTAQRIAQEVMEGTTYLSDVGSSTHYHANYVKPRWAKRLKKMDVIGNHIFYKLRPGQT
jgi:hypothetical protein